MCRDRKGAAGTPPGEAEKQRRRRFAAAGLQQEHSSRAKVSPAAAGSEHAGDSRKSEEATSKQAAGRRDAPNGAKRCWASGECLAAVLLGRRGLKRTAVTR